ncbi:EF hand domain-containing protein [Sphingomonas sp. PP-F2F-G114-C0414]|uniref:EF-hand domain-containing protein n=1 Tax=Sphingomonas sp. PP-F2F-G114-C0414 TaxID=2135662 RepID=UPI000EF8766F|nr:EF-hand domain-containing protein [Sphingomonas sp. PP-F2F-G114-C0414]RMB36017.1 EF hand domain-containing protein [Sphingomonas sp. PP-F2F-G114-C0414]
MWRYLAGGTAVIALIVAGFVFFNGDARPRPLLPAQPISQVGGAAVASDPLPDAAPEATDKTREQKRFDRYDKDRDSKITREEYLVQRRKAYARLDVDGDGKLSFDEWAVKATTKFADADRDKSGTMTAPEFATTAVKRKGPARVNCPPAQPAAEES